MKSAVATAGRLADDSGMTEKRKPTYEQDRALARGRDVARANQRRRVAANQAADKARAERERQEAQHAADHANAYVYTWGNWEYSADYKTETRVCRECGMTETRPVRL